MNTNKTKTDQKRRLRILSAVCLSILLLVTAASAEQSKLPENGKIAFASIVKEQYDIFTMNSDGTKLTNLTNSPEQDEISPSWSPDGKRLAFLYKLDERSYVIGYVDADGSNMTMLLEVFLPKSDGDTLSWSPDGKSIAFTSEGDIYSMAIDNGYPVNLTNNPPYNRQPSFSPNGEQIAFTRQEENGLGVFTMYADGGKVERTLLGADFKGASAAKFSPDGNRFLFLTNLEGGCSCLVSAKTDGTDNDILAVNASSADWSPDGTKVVFAREDGSSSQIYVTPANGDGPQYPIGPKGARQPDWQPLP